MRIPHRFAPLLFSALLSAIMVGLVSAFVLVTSQGLHANLVHLWAESFFTTWPFAFVTVAIVAPWVRKVVDKLIA